MVTPVQFMKQYRNLGINAVQDDAVAQVCRDVTYTVQLKTYFMMNWTSGSEQSNDYNTVVRGAKQDQWGSQHREFIRNAAMGKGSPRDYKAALDWAVLSGKIRNVNQSSIQKYCDNHLGIDCSGLVTNYLIANNRLAYSASKVRNTNAASYFDQAKAQADPMKIKQGDLLVWMDGSRVKRSPGHIAIVESYVPQCRPGGNMRVVEATGTRAALPRLLDSMYSVEKIQDKTARSPMVLTVKRHGKSGSRVAVIRPV